jgi:hypothetical protein
MPMNPRDAVAGRRTVAAALSILALLLGGCAALPSALVRSGPEDPGTRIPGIDRCDRDSPGVVDLDPDRPLILLVHGCRSSGGRFRALARVFEAHGQQALCFNYDDRNSLRDASVDLITALQALKARLKPRQITILGHSQGGLVARRALIRERRDPLPEGDGFTYRLLTASSPLNGIQASAICGRPWVHFLTLGFTHVICHGISGEKWTEIFPNAPFMERPGTLIAAVTEHLQVVTDERGICRRANADGSCAKLDFVFDVDEQRNARVSADPRVVIVPVSAGHVEIVGTEGVVPVKLLELLQERGILAATAPERRIEMANLLARLFGPNP